LAFCAAAREAVSEREPAAGSGSDLLPIARGLDEVLRPRNRMGPMLARGTPPQTHAFAKPPPRPVFSRLVVAIWLPLVDGFLLVFSQAFDFMERARGTQPVAPGPPTEQDAPVNARDRRLPIR
jgi:hypothetical protein